MNCPFQLGVLWQNLSLALTEPKWSKAPDREQRSKVVDLDIMIFCSMQVLQPQVHLIKFYIRTSLPTVQVRLPHKFASSPNLT